MSETRASGSDALHRLGIVGASASMRDLFVRVRRCATVLLPVLIRGETGTGKDLVARALHAESPRARRSFLPVHCGALPDSLVESELFGHLKGTFTGALQSRRGLLAEADGGTVFLDEVGELSLLAQAKLLRFLQDGEIRPIGSPHPRKIDVRVLAATHRDLEREVAQGRFREDLFFRLQVLDLTVPPLRSRGDDVLLLAKHFLDENCRKWNLPPRRLAPCAREALLAHDWPGNVRELENQIRRCVALSSTSPLVTAGDLDRMEALPRQPMTRLREQMERAEAGFVAAALDRSNGCRAAAARRLGISRQTLYVKLRKHGLD